MAGIRSKLIKSKEEMTLPGMFGFLRGQKCSISHHLQERKLHEPFWPSIYASPFTPELRKDG